jgi:ADP-ribose pyrophosphatase YjhB (NUDIX family)
MPVKARWGSRREVRGPRLWPWHRLLQRGLLAYGRLSRGITLGVRGVVLAEQRVLLVRHSYVPGWYLPGGGVEPGETAEEALARELDEEAGVRLTARPELFGFYHNVRANRLDHVALYVCRAWERQPRRASAEIRACELFPLADLPEDATPATRARLEEVLGGGPPAATW